MCERSLLKYRKAQEARGERHVASAGVDVETALANLAESPIMSTATATGATSKLSQVRSLCRAVAGAGADKESNSCSSRPSRPRRLSSRTLEERPVRCLRFCRLNRLTGCDCNLTPLTACGKSQTKRQTPPRIPSPLPLPPSRHFSRPL